MGGLWGLGLVRVGLNDLGRLGSEMLNVEC